MRYAKRYKLKVTKSKIVRYGLRLVSVQHLNHIAEEA